MKRNSPLVWLLVAGISVAAVAVLVLSGGSTAPPFDVSSSEPDGYRAIGILLGEAGVDVSSAGPDAEALRAGPGEAVVVPVAQYLDDDQLDTVLASAESGATVVFGDSSGFFTIDRQELMRTPALPVPRGFCDMADLEDLEAVDDIAGTPAFASAGEQRCFDSGNGPVVTRDSMGSGQLVTLASPYVWANARLQPDKEEGGRALDNGPMAVALLGDRDSVRFVEARPAPGSSPSGTQNPIALMPLPVKMALLQVVGAFLLYAWFRGRRLGRPVHEDMPVEVAGSELVEAVGGLLRRSGTPASAAEVLRAQTRRDLSVRLGVPPTADPTPLVSAVAAKTGRMPQEVRNTLVDGRVGTPDELLVLSRALDDLHSEVLDARSRR